MAKFEDLIDSLGERLHKKLHANVNNVVTLLVNQTVKVQLEADRHQEMLTVAAYVAELPPGRFRERVLKEALKANYGANILPGVLSFVGKENALLLFEKMPLSAVSVESLITRIKAFCERSKLWNEAINNGRPSPEEVVVKTTHQKRGSIFGR